LGDGFAQWEPTLVFKTSYIVFDGVTGGGPGNYFSGHGFKMQGGGSEGAVLRHILLSDKWGGETDRIDVSNITIAHLEIRGVYPPQPCATVGIESSAQGAWTNDLTVRYCHLVDASWAPIQVNNGNRLVF